MKYLNKISVLLMVLIAGLFAACNTDQEGPSYDKQGVSFLSSSLTGVSVPSTDPTFTVEVVRASGEGTLSGEVTISAVVGEEPLEGCTVTGFNFAEGETTTQITVNVEPLAVGVDLDVTLTLNVTDDLIAVGGNKTTTITVQKEYNWVELGTGSFIENFFIGIEVPVTILKAEGFERYRVMNPYDEVYTGGVPDGFTSSLAKASYIEFWINEGLVYYNAFGIGLNYTGLGDVYAYHPTALKMDGSNNKVIDDKTIALAPIFYMPDSPNGSYFDGSTYEDTYLVILP